MLLAVILGDAYEYKSTLQIIIDGSFAIWMCDLSSGH